MQPVSSQQTNNVVLLPGSDQTRVTPSFVARIHLLGQMRALTVRRSDILPRGRKARAILGFLCFSKGVPVPRARLAALLWDRVPSCQARASLRQALRELMMAFGPVAAQLLLVERDTVRLDVTVCWIDAVALLAQEAGTKDVRGKLAELCNGDLLEDLDGLSAAFDQWLLGKRTSLKTNLRDLLTTELQQGEDSAHREAIARRLVDFDPTHEGASGVLMRALVDRKERGQALQEYKRLQAALKLAFDAPPALETRALYETIRALDKDEVPSSDLAEEPRSESSRALACQKRSHRRVGVLPFMAIPPDADQSLAFSLAQEVAAALARFRWFDVVAPTALLPAPAPTFLNDVQLRRKELDYVIDGSVSLSRGNYRISVRLLDLITDATPVWTSTFELPADRLDLLDEHVTAPIVAQIDPVILFIEGREERRNARDDALCCVLRALPLLNTMERPKYEEGGRLIERAMALEPDNPLALAWAAYWHVFYLGQGWASDAALTSQSALDLALRATQLDPANAEAHAIYAHILSFVRRDSELALHHFDEALRLNRYLPFVWVYSGLTYCYLGDPETALQRFQRCRELTATLPYFSLHENPFAIAYLMKGRYQDAIAASQRVVQNTPTYVNGYKPLIAALGHLGRRKAARPYVSRLLEIEPNFTVKRFERTYPFVRGQDLEHYAEGLRRAGVPKS